VNLAGIVAVALIGGVILFQIALVLGAPWGAAAWGGQNPGRLPARLRVASLVAAAVLAFIAWVVAAAAGVVAVSPLPQLWLGPATWIATGYFGLGTIANLISRSPVERWWSPVALATAVCCAIVATG
jgi:hypothetical protein